MFIIIILESKSDVEMKPNTPTYKPKKILKINYNIEKYSSDSKKVTATTKII